AGHGGRRGERAVHIEAQVGAVVRHRDMRPDVERERGAAERVPLAADEHLPHRTARVLVGVEAVDDSAGPLLEDNRAPGCAVGGGGATLLTVTATSAEVVVFVDGSRAVAVSLWVPFADVVVSHETEYGVVVSSSPSAIPSSLN